MGSALTLRTLGVGVGRLGFAWHSACAGAQLTAWESRVPASGLLGGLYLLLRQIVRHELLDLCLAASVNVAVGLETRSWRKVLYTFICCAINPRCMARCNLQRPQSPCSCPLLSFRWCLLQGDRTRAFSFSSWDPGQAGVEDSSGQVCSHQSPGSTSPLPLQTLAERPGTPLPVCSAHRALGPGIKPSASTLQPREQVCRVHVHRV